MNYALSTINIYTSKQEAKHKINIKYKIYTYIIKQKIPVLKDKWRRLNNNYLLQCKPGGMHILPVQKTNI